MRPALFCAALCGLSILTSPAGARGLPEIRGSEELRICLAGSSRAFYQANAEAFARFLRVRPKVTVLAEWDQQFQNTQGVTVQDATYEAKLLADGTCDVFPNDLHMLDWRRSKMLLVPYYTTRKMVVAHRKMRGELKQPSDLAGHRAAVQKGTGYESWLVQQNMAAFAANPVLVDTLPTAEAMNRVAEGAADFTIIGAEAAFRWVRGDLDNLDLLFPIDEPVEVGWGISPASTDLRDQLDRFFTDSRRVGSELDRAWQRQYGISLMEYQLFEASFTSMDITVRKVLAWALPAVTGVLGVLAAMLFWTRRLNREIARHRRTELELRETQEALGREASRRLAVARITLDLQQTASIGEFGRALLSNLAREMAIGQGIFCLWRDGAEQLQTIAGYAGNALTPGSTFERPENGSLVERCLATGETLVVGREHALDLRIRSGLGHCAPAAVILFPVKRSGLIIALIEVALLRHASDEDVRLLQELEPIVGVLAGKFSDVSSFA